MKTSEAYEATESLRSSMPNIFGSVIFEFPFKERPRIGVRYPEQNCGLPITGDGIGSKSGVYLITTPEEEIIYIGKATKNNLHGRVWSHLETPKNDSNGNWLFPNNDFANKELNSFSSDDNMVKLVTEGNAFIKIITISDPQTVSLVEVYLQTLHQIKHEKLPYFNKKIG